MPVQSPILYLVDFWVSNTCLRTIKVMQCYYEYIGAMYHVHFCMHTIIHNIDNVGIYVCVYVLDYCVAL